LFDKGNFGLIPEAGTMERNGTAAAGLGRESGVPGLPAPGMAVKTHREAKPIQTAQPSYPPMALRMGL
jgi:hypothetical protein